MHTKFSPLVRSHLTTTNLYVRRSIIAGNIARITSFQNSTPKENVSTHLYFEIANLKKKQVSILKEIDLQINFTEQHVFKFGG